MDDEDEEAAGGDAKADGYGDAHESGADGACDGFGEAILPGWRVARPGRMKRLTRGSRAAHF